MVYHKGREVTWLTDNRAEGLANDPVLYKSAEIAAIKCAHDIGASSESRGPQDTDCVKPK